MSKEHGDFEIGDKVKVDTKKRYSYLHLQDYDDLLRPFTIIAIYIDDRRLWYQLQNKPTCSYFFRAEDLTHV